MLKNNRSSISGEKCFVSVTDDIAKVKALVDTLKVPSRLELICQGDPLEMTIPLCESYNLTCSLLKFLQNEFIDTFIRGKNVFTIVSQTKLDHEDSFAIINGKLFMSLTKSTFEQAGLPGRKSKLDSSRYIVTYDLRNTNLNVGHTGFDRLLWSLSNTIIGREFHFLLTVSHKLSEELLNYFNGSDLKESPIKFQSSSIKDVMIPSWQLPLDSQSSSTYKRIVFEEWVTNRLEWSALVSLGSDQVLSTCNVDSYLSQYSVLDSSESENVSLTTISREIDKIHGLNNGPLISSITDSFLASIFSAVKPQWFVLNIYGYENTPVAWNEREHALSGNGLNHLTIFKLPDDNYVIMKLMNGKDLMA